MIALRSKINVDKRAKITTGIKAVSEKTQKEYPKAVDYFVIEDFPELKKSYGEKPKKLVLFFPDNEIEAFFSADYVLYGGNQTLIRKCDGQECIHRIDEEVGEKKYGAGEIGECVCTNLPDDDKKRCRIATYIKAYIADTKTGKIENPLCYLFYTGSRNSTENLYSELKKIRNLLGGNLIGIPFGLSVDMVSGRTDAKQKFPIWNLQVLGTTSQLRAAMESYLFDYKEILKIEEGGDKEEQKTGEASPTELFNPADLNDPGYFIKKIKAFKVVAELNKFIKQHKKDLEFFGDVDKDKIETAIAEAYKNLQD